MNNPFAKKFRTTSNPAQDASGAGAPAMAVNQAPAGSAYPGGSSGSGESGVSYGNGLPAVNIGQSTTEEYAAVLAGLDRPHVEAYLNGDPEACALQQARNAMDTMFAMVAAGQLDAEAIKLVNELNTRLMNLAKIQQEIIVLERKKVQLEEQAVEAATMKIDDIRAQRHQIIERCWGREDLASVISQVEYVGKTQGETGEAGEAAENTSTVDFPGYAHPTMRAHSIPQKQPA